MALSLPEVLASHREMLDTRLVNSVVPEQADIPVDPAELTNLAVELGGTGFFSERGVISERPRNLLGKFDFVLDGAGLVTNDGDSANERAARATEVWVGPIDRHFRNLAGIDEATRTEPIVSLSHGLFTGAAATDTNRHFDYKLKMPVVSYKMHVGDPRFSSVYYPGLYRLPGNVSIYARVLAGVDPTIPKPLFSRREAREEIMPSGVVCLEPWNAYHSGPTDKKARYTTRGIAVVTYDLAKLLRSDRPKAYAPSDKV